MLTRRVFEEALEDIKSHLRPERALVLYQSEDQDLSVRAAHGVEKETVWTTAPLSLTVFSRVYRSGEPLLCADAQSEPGLEDISSLLLSGIRSVVCVPIFGGRQVRGLLYADQRMERSFSDHDLQVLTHLARDVERRLEAPTTAPPPAPPRPAETPARALKMSSRQRVVFLRSLATMLAAGVPLTRALALLGEQGPVGARMLAEVEKGRTLSEAMSACGVFSPFHLQLARVGEHSGALVEVMEQLARQEEKDRALSMRVRSALTYPVGLFVVCTAMLLVVPPLFLKSQLQFLATSGVEPPWITRAVLAATTFLASPVGMLSLLAVLLIGAAIGRAAFRQRTWFMHLPRLGEGLRLLTTVRFARSLALQLHVGMPVLEAVPAAAATTADPVLLREIPSAVQAMKAGAELAASLNATGYFPRGFLVILAVGEESGHMAETLQWVARLYEMELDSALEIACAALEPVMMLVMGFAAALICLATMLPLVQLVQAL